MILVLKQADIFKKVFSMFEDFFFREQAFDEVHLENAFALGKGRNHHVLQKRQFREDFRRLEDTRDTKAVVI